MKKKFRLGYLSGAPRVATHAETETSGPRSHVLGVIGAFEKLGWNVEKFIVGDRVPKSWTKKGSEKQVSSNIAKRLAADLIRLWFRVTNSRKAFSEIGNDVDVVYERFAAMQAMGRLFQKNDIPWILETNAPLFYEAKMERKSTLLGALVHRLEIKAYKDCDYLVCVSEKLKDIIVNEGGIKEDKIFVIPNGVDTDLFNPKNLKASLTPKDKLVVGFVGTLREWQRLDLLISAISELRKEGIDISFVVVGDGPGKKQWIELTEKLNVSDLVTFEGRVRREEVPAYLKGFDMGYSAPEPMKIGMYLSPLKIYEYMSMEVPVLAMGSEDSTNLINNGENGFIISELNSNSIKEQLRKAEKAYRSGNLQEMKSKARQMILGNHSWVSRIEYLLSNIELSNKIE